MIEKESSIKEKRYIKGTCANCQEQVVSPEATSGPPVAVGHNLIALLAIMREQMGVSYRKLERKLQTLMKIKSTNKKATVLVNRIKRHKNELLRFVKHKEVEYPIIIELSVQYGRL